MGTFVEVSLTKEAGVESEQIQGLIGLCPVDIFAAGPDGVTVQEDKVDECTLCGLCWEKLPRGVKVTKLY
jgi:NAD-dependent dihydropyrimidine dehydrogenase PreA subunit